LDPLRHRNRFSPSSAVLNRTPRSSPLLSRYGIRTTDALWYRQSVRPTLRRKSTGSFFAFAYSVRVSVAVLHCSGGVTLRALCSRNRSPILILSAAQMDSTVQPAWQQSKILPLASPIESEGLRSRCAGQRAIQPSLERRTPLSLATKSSAFVVERLWETCFASDSEGIIHP